MAGGLVEEVYSCARCALLDGSLSVLVLLPHQDELAWFDGERGLVIFSWSVGLESQKFGIRLAAGFAVDLCPQTSPPSHRHHHHHPLCRLLVPPLPSPVLSPHPSMEFWRKIISTTPVRRADASTPPVSPEARLERYKRSWTAVQKSWAALCNPHAIQHTSAFQQQLIHHISAQTRLLLDRPASRLCLEYTLRARVVPELGKIARNSPSNVACAVVRCLVSMIDAADEDFLADESVCGSISELAGSFHAGLDDEYRESLMELLFNVAATTKVQRGLLGLWFHLARDVGSISETSTATDVPSSVVGAFADFYRTTFLFSMRCWRMSLPRDGLEILPRRVCSTLSNWPTRETNSKNGSSQAT